MLLLFFILPSPLVFKFFIFVLLPNKYYLKDISKLMGFRPFSV